MAEEEIGYSINLDTNAMQKSLEDLNIEIGDLTTSTKELNKAQKDLEKDGKKGSKQWQENNKQIVENKENQKALKKEYNETSKVIQNTNKVRKTEAGHLEKLKAELSIVTQNINKMSKEQLKDNKIGGAAIKKQKELTIELTNAEKAGGNFKRVVGDYGNEMGNSTKKISLFGKASKGLTGGLSSMGKTIGGSVTKAFKSFGAALKANPIFFIIGIITATIGVMKKLLKPFQPLLDWISDKISYVSGLIDGFTSSLSAIGDIIGKVFSGDFAGAAEAMGKMSDNISAVAEATENLNRVMREQDAIQKENNLTTQESMAHQKELQTIIKDTTLSEQERAEALKELKKIQKGQTQDDINEKMARYNAINESVNATLKAQGSSIKDISSISSDMLGDLRNEGKLTEDQFNQIVDSRNEVAKANEAAANVDTQLVRYDAQLKREREAERKKQHDAYLKRIADEQKAEEDRLKTLEGLYNQAATLQEKAELKKLKGTEKYYDLLQQQTDTHYKKEKKAIFKSGDDIETMNAKLAVLDLKYKAQSEKTTTEKTKFIQNEEKKTFEYKVASTNKQMELDTQLVEHGVGTEEEKAEAKKQIQIKYLEDITALYIEEMDKDGVRTEEELAKYEEFQAALNELKTVKVEEEDITRQEKMEKDIAVAEQTFNHIQGLLNQAIELNNATRDAEMAKINKSYNIKEKAQQDYLKEEKKRLLKQKKDGLISEEEYNKAVQGLEADYNTNKEIMDNERLEKENKAKQKAFEKNKKYQIANVWIDAASGIMSVWSSAGELGPIAGPALALVTSSLITGTAVEQTSQINNTQFTAAGGGILNGPLHAAGGINMGDIEAEGGEFIINRASTKRYEPLLNSINSAGNTNGDTNNTSDIIDYDRLAGAIQSKKVYVVSHDITEQQGEDTEIVDRTTF